MATRKSAAKTASGKSKKVETKAAKPAASTKPAGSPKTTRMAFDLDELETLMKSLDRHGITELELEKSGERIVIRRGTSSLVAAPVAMPAYVPQVAAPAPVAAAPAAPAAAAPAAQADDANVTFVTSPFVGTFYRAANPTAPVFCDVGSKVRKGQTLCIVEAMKLMNEIECEFDGTIVEILAENGKPVEYGDRLFKIKR